MFLGPTFKNFFWNDYFFENIKQLVKGDVIIYQKGEEKKQYIVDTVAIISEEDWSYLQNTTDNRITLITCVINQPNYRLCVQGVEFWII